eukprot:4043720-Amphidinium_carterae.1
MDFGGTQPPAPGPQDAFQAHAAVSLPNSLATHAIAIKLFQIIFEVVLLCFVPCSTKLLSGLGFFSCCTYPSWTACDIVSFQLERIWLVEVNVKSMLG